MSSKRVRFVAMALAVLLAVVMVIGLILNLVTPARASSKLDELRDSAEELAEEKKKVQDEISRLDDDKAEATRRKEALDKQIEITNAEIDNAVALIEALNYEIDDRQAALEEAVREEALQLETFRLRIRTMEEAGDAQYLGVLLQADSFSDLLGRFSVVQDIMEYDLTMLDNLKAARERVDAEKKALQRDRDEQNDVKQELSDRYVELDAQYQEQQRLIDEIKSKIVEFEKLEDEFDAQSKEIEEEIVKEQERLEEERKRLEELAELAKQEQGENWDPLEQPVEYVVASGDFLWPCPAGSFSSPYGYRYHPILGYVRFHSGVDLSAPSGSKILASNDGTVIIANYGSGYGNYVVIDHGGGRSTLYAHMSRILVDRGQAVSRGETIGLVGSTGLATGPHLHFEIHINGSTTNPMNYF